MDVGGPWVGVLSPYVIRRGAVREWEKYVQRTPGKRETR